MRFVLRSTGIPASAVAATTIAITAASAALAAAVAALAAAVAAGAVVRHHTVQRPVDGQRAAVAHPVEV